MCEGDDLKYDNFRFGDSVFIGDNFIIVNWLVNYNLSTRYTKRI